VDGRRKFWDFFPSSDSGWFSTDCLPSSVRGGMEMAVSPNVIRRRKSIREGAREGRCHRFPAPAPHTHMRLRESDSDSRIGKRKPTSLSSSEHNSPKYPPTPINYFKNFPSNYFRNGNRIFFFLKNDDSNSKLSPPKKIPFSGEGVTLRVCPMKRILVRRRFGIMDVNPCWNNDIMLVGICRFWFWGSGLPGRRVELCIRRTPTFPLR